MSRAIRQPVPRALNLAIVRRLREWLAAPTSLPPPQWLRRGLPRPIAAILLIVAPLFWTGVVRTLSGVSLALALLPAILVTTLASLPFVATLRRRPETTRADRLLAAAVMAIPAVLVLFLLFNRFFGGLLVIVDGDSGTHVALRDQFVTRNPEEYAGFVTFYALTWWLERLRASAFFSFAACFYAAALLYATVPLIAVLAVVDRLAAAPRRRRAVVVGTLLMWLLALGFISLPLFHYHQAEGFFVHVFGIAPLLLLWLVDGLVRPPRLRLLAVGVGVLAYRYTYGLNLGDLLLAATALVALDARACSRRPAGIGLLALVGGALLIAAGYCYRRLDPLWQLNGWITPPDLRLTLAAQWILSAICVAALAIPALRERLGGSGITRWLRLPVAFGVANATVVTWMLRHPPPQVYYLAKYNLHALWLLIAATTVLLAALSAAPANDARPAILARALVVIATMFAAVTLYRGIAAYRAGFLERAFGRPPFKILHPLADLGAWSRIERTLHREHKEFGGYLTTYYPVMNFMNAAFGFPNGGIHFYYGRAPREGVGYCDFWEAGPPQSWLEADFPQRAARARWNQTPDKQCVSYRAHWNPELVRTLCWFCR